MRVEIKPIFFISLFVIIALKLTGQFFIVFLLISLHEAAHILTAKSFGLDVQKAVVTPFGVAAVIDGLCCLGGFKRGLVLIAGPAVNFLLAALTSDKYTFFRSANLMIGIFNLLPVYPLDGGRIVHIVLCKAFGVFKANKIIIMVSKILACVLIAAGFAQVILFSPNISLLGVGVYIVKSLERERINLLVDFYKLMVIKTEKWYNEEAEKK